MSLANKVILVTGGTGSFGQEFVRIALQEQNPKVIRIFSRGEFLQYQMQQRFDNDPRLRFFIGDVRDRERIRFSAPAQVKEYLKGIASTGIVSENGIVSGQIKKEKQLLDTNDASEFLGIRKNTLYEWVIQKKIPHIKVGKLLKFKKEDLDAWLKKRTQEESEDIDI